MAPSLPNAFKSCRELVSSMFDSEFDEAFRSEVSLKYGGVSVRSMVQFRVSTVCVEESKQCRE